MVTATPVVTEAPTAEPTAEPTLAAESLYNQTASAGADYSDPATNNLVVTKVYGEKTVSSAVDAADAAIQMGSSEEYSTLEGITTFRGSHYRDSGSYGTIPENPSKLSVVWKKRISGLDEWNGVGWTGQASVIRWPAELRQAMNINKDKRNKDGLIEAIYATLDGRIYFLDLEDGEETRKAINIGAPIKGSLSVDPRGVPLLYCGQGIYDVEGERVDCGTRIWSLIDQKRLFFLNGQDDYAVRPWRAFDCSPLVDAATDTMITAGENGVLYNITLNTRWDGQTVSIKPDVQRYVYKQTAGGKVGSENSVVIYNSYVYFASNIGIIQCVDLNTMELVWSFDAKDDIDATMVIEAEPDGTVGLYATNELDNRGSKGTCQMFKLNALTGELLWVRNSDNLVQHNKNGGGGFATPAVGKNDLSNLVFFHICRTEKTGGMLYALDKTTGDTVWEKKMGVYGWSSPTCVYTPSGKGYIVVGTSDGDLLLLDGLSGKTVDKTTLKGNIEATPVVFDDMLIVGTRSAYIYGVKIK